MRQMVLLPRQMVEGSGAEVEVEAGGWAVDVAPT